MIVDLACQPAYAVAYVRLGAGEEMYCESGSMIAMSSGVEIAGSTGGGIAKAVLRKAVGQESFFMARYQSRVEGGWVALAPKFPGDIATINVTNQKWLMQTGSMLAHSAGIHSEVRFGGLGSLLQQEGVTLIEVEGQGQLVICSYGGLQRINPGPGERVVVDTGHLVAWTADMAVRIGPLSGVVTAAVTGEHLVAEFKGPGEVWIQTRSERQLQSWLLPDRAQNEN